jgi:hypothetical protein
MCTFLRLYPLETGLWNVLSGMQPQMVRDSLVTVLIPSARLFVGIPILITSASVGVLYGALQRLTTIH